MRSANSEDQPSARTRSGATGHQCQWSLSAIFDIPTSVSTCRIASSPIVQQTQAKRIGMVFAGLPTGRCDHDHSPRACADEDELWQLMAHQRSAGGLSQRSYRADRTKVNPIHMRKVSGIPTRMKSEKR